MSDRELRSVVRIDYKILHNTGEITPFNEIREIPTEVDESSDESTLSGSEGSIDNNIVEGPEIACLSASLQHCSLKEMDTELRIKFSLEESLNDDITDFIDENPIEELLVIEDINTCISKLEDLRSKYRNVHREIRRIQPEQYTEDLKDKEAKVMKSIKKHISSAKEIRNDIRNREVETTAKEIYAKNKKEEEDMSRNETAVEFLNVDIDRMIRSISNEIKLENVSNDQSILNDDEIMEMRKRFPDIQRRIDNVANRCKEMLDLIPLRTDPRRDHTTALTNRVNDIIRVFKTFMTNVKSEIRSREINKEKKFQASSLKINVPKFKGYDSPLDIYTFKDKFDQLYSQYVPVRALPELLKNNYLEGPALETVKRLDTIEEIWLSLKKAFGDPRVMLLKKVGELESIGSLGKVRDAEKVKDGLNKIMNIMQDLMRLANNHDIEEKLYHGDGIYSIYRILGDAKVTKFIERTCDNTLDGKDLWEELLRFLERDIKVQLEKSMIYRTFPERKSSQETKRSDGKTHVADNVGKGNVEESIDESNSFNTQSTNTSSKTNNPSQTSKVVPGVCFLCGKGDHVPIKGPYGKKLIQYFSCKTFADSCPAARLLELKRKDLCMQCLFPGACASTGKHAEGKCQNTYVCKHESHASFTIKKHILVCEEHKNTDDNKALLEEYRRRCITRKCNSDLPDYAKSIQVAFHCSHLSHEAYRADADEGSEHGIYMFQWIKVNNEPFLVFYDSGCSDLLITHDAKTRLGYNATQIYDGTVSVGGVGGCAIESPHGACEVSIPLHNGRNAVMRGLVIDKITEEFPTYVLNTEVEGDIRAEYKQSAGDVNNLPRLYHSVGHHVDIMIGAATYNRYFPTEIFRTESGLAIFLSSFLSLDGSRGVVVGPHKSFTATNKNFFSQQQKSTQAFLLTKHAQLFKTSCQNELNLPDIKLQELKCNNNEEGVSCRNTNCMCVLVSRNQKSFDEVEKAGNQITYRCVNCRNCQGCKNGERIEMISTREEVEQTIINKSVKVDLKSRLITASLPFMEDPVQALKPNKELALVVYRSQLRKLNNDPEAKAEVIAAENQLQELGFVDYVKNLTDKQRKKLFDTALQYFIPWRVVWNSNSITTACRIVFDASMPTRSGKSLNDVLAKGQNSMNRLVEVVIRWFMRRIGLHADVKKMYNSVKLDEEDWSYQMYLFEKNLDPNKEPEPKFIKTAIYGIKSSGNQAELGLRETARLQKEKYPRAYEIATAEVYVDDCLSGENTIDQAHQTADELQSSLSNGGLYWKGFTFSGKPPPSHLSRDGQSINVTGLKWYSEEDTIQLDIGELNFATKQRGKKPCTDNTRHVPLSLTRKHCVSKVAEIYDISGKITPLTAGMKLDLHDLVVQGIKWKDQIPDELRHVWSSHFEMMQEIPTLRYNRSIIPEDAVFPLEIHTIDTGDASKSIACIAIYAQIKRENGEYSCQLVFSRSKLIDDGTTQPRCELIAAMLNSHTGEVVKRAFGKYHKSSIKLSDSQIVLHWINNDHKALKQWVRTRVIEILRFTTRKQWYFVESELLIADLGTRRGVKLLDVNMYSCWINGYEWMRKEKSTFPISAISNLCLSKSDNDSYKKELFAPYQRAKDLTMFEMPHVYVCSPGSFVFNNKRFEKAKITARYEYSQYLIDPNKHSFTSAVRVMALVYRFIKNCRLAVNLKEHNHTRECSTAASDVLVLLTDDELKEGKDYFFRKASDEIRHFVKPSEYEKISIEKEGILYYTGRILPTQRVDSVVSLTDVMKDLSGTSFFVPIVDSHSPVAYSVVNDVHWNHEVANHRGVETVHRYVLQLCYIRNGRDLVKMFRKNCERCRYLAKRTIDIEMGAVSSQNLTIAPAFYITQVDIAGPFLSFSPHNKRVTVKIYFVIYCCSTTSSVSIKVMEDYSAPSFLQSFIRFSCEVGYPKILVSDEGSQLVKGYSDMRISFTDLKNKLNSLVSVEFDIVPIGGHNMTGKVERTVKEVKQSIEKSYQNQKLSILQWETVCAQIANTINDMPLALGNVVSDFESMDLITPNRLRLGRNNNRSPVGPLYVTNDPSKFFDSNTNIFNTWFETWLISHVPKLMNQPKWFNTQFDLAEGDVVLFLKKEGLLNTTYQYGMVKRTELGRDGKIRTVVLKYQNHNETFDRETKRAVRQLVMIHKVDELNIIQELGAIATITDMKRKINKCICN